MFSEVRATRHSLHFATPDSIDIRHVVMCRGCTLLICVHFIFLSHSTYLLLFFLSDILYTSTHIKCALHSMPVLYQIILLIYTIHYSMYSVEPRRNCCSDTTGEAAPSAYWIEGEE